MKQSMSACVVGERTYYFKLRAQFSGRVRNSQEIFSARVIFFLRDGGAVARGQQ
jgi:hypothetical protein